MENMVRTQLRSGLLTSCAVVAEEHNLSDDTKNRLIDLLVEKQLKTVDMASQIGELQRGNITSEENIKNSIDIQNRLFNGYIEA